MNSERVVSRPPLLVLPVLLPLPLSLHLFLSLSLLLILGSLLQFLWLSRLLASAHVHLNVLGVLKYYYIKGMTESRACLEYPVGEVIWHIKTVDLSVLQ